MVEKKIFIDLATIYAGVGGSGGGIWSYAKNFIINLDNSDRINDKSIKYYVLVNKEFNVELKNINILRYNINLKRIFNRLFYVHVMLPWICKKKKATLLHKLASEIPFFLTTDIIITIHDFMNEFYMEKGYVNPVSIKKLKSVYFSFIAKKAIMKAKGIVVPSNCIKNELISRYGNRKILITHLGVSDKGQYKECNKEINSVYCIAGFYPHKGHFKTIESFEYYVSKYGKTLKLFFRGNIGDLDYYYKVKNRINASKYKDLITIIPYSESTSLRDIYCQADLLILLTEYEGFGLPILEAQIFGVPILCSEIPVLIEVGGNGVFTVPYNDIVAVSDSMFEIIHNPKIVSETIAKGLINVDRFKWSTNAELVIDLYSQILNN